MLTLTSSTVYTNQLGLVLSQKNTFNLCQILIDLHLGIPVSLDVDFECFGLVNSLRESKGYYKVVDGRLNDTIEFLVFSIEAVQTESISNLCLLKEHIRQYMPTVYGEVLQSTVDDNNLAYLFGTTSLVIFCFKNGKLSFISDSTENNISNFLFKTVRKDIQSIPYVAIEQLLSKYDQITVSLSSPYSWNRNIFPLSLFVTKDYFRLNSLEIAENSFSLLWHRDYLSGTYNTKISMVDMLTVLLMPDNVTTSMTQNLKSRLGKYILSNDSGNCKAVGISIKENIFPIICYRDAITTTDKWITLTLSNEDLDFLEKLKTLDKSTIYTKHKHFLNPPNKEVRGCKSIHNASKTIKVLIKEDKKTISDEEAYKNRLFRDYLSYAVSMVCIPIFQKEFIIPEYLKSKFQFKMVSLEGTNYKSAWIGNDIRFDNNYQNKFTNAGTDSGWSLSQTPKVHFANNSTVIEFLSDIYTKKLTASTESRPSIFTRHFVFPFIEKSKDYSPPVGATPFGWMFLCDNMSVYSSRSNGLSTSHLLRCTADSYSTFSGCCGLVSDKTLGIQSIMSHVFYNNTLMKSPMYYKTQSILSVDTDNSVSGLRFLPSFNELTSAHLAILEANFILNDTIETKVKNNISYKEDITRINQLMFLSAESLAILNSIYNCKTYTELAESLNVYMPTCLEMVAELDEYSESLKDHVTGMLTYFWKTTVAISKEMLKNETSTDETL